VGEYQKKNKKKENYKHTLGLMDSTVRGGGRGVGVKLDSHCDAAA